MYTFSDLTSDLLIFEQTKLNLDEGTLRQSVVLFRETKHVLLANMSAIGSGSVIGVLFTFLGTI